MKPVRAYSGTYLQQLPRELRELVPMYRYSTVQFHIDDIDVEFQLLGITVTIRGDITVSVAGSLYRDRGVTFIQSVIANPKSTQMLQLEYYMPNPSNMEIIYENGIIRFETFNGVIYLNGEYTKAFIRKLQFLLKRWNDVVMGDVI